MESAPGFCKDLRSGFEQLFDLGLECRLESGRGQHRWNFLLGKRAGLTGSVRALNHFTSSP